SAPADTITPAGGPQAAAVLASAAPSNDVSINGAKKPDPGTAPRGALAAPASPPSTTIPATATTLREASAKELFAAKPDANGVGVNAGLRFRLIRLADGQQAEVDPATTTFHSGDRVRFAFDSNIDGYLYVVQQGSSGRWTVLFPGSKINGGRNAVKRAE